MDQQIVQQNVQRQVRAVADVVFVIDASGSMDSCIEGLKEHIGDFVRALESDPKVSSVDTRVAIVGHRDPNFHRQPEFDILDFTADLGTFRQALSRLEADGDEYTLPAIDYALDMEWRTGAHRIVIAFTDEDLDGGCDEDFQRSKLRDLCYKLGGLRVTLAFFGIRCPEYELLQQVPRSLVTFVEDGTEFYAADFDKTLAVLGKTLSTGTLAAGQIGGAGTVPRDLYDNRSRVTFRDLI